MSEHLQLTIESENLHPGEHLRGRVDATGRKHLRLQIGWHTRGKGDQNSQVYAAHDLQGSSDFDVVMPEGPQTCYGVLVSIQWSVSVMDKKSGEVATRFFSLTSGSGPLAFVVAPSAEP